MRNRSSHNHTLNFGASHAGVFPARTEITAEGNHSQSNGSGKHASGKYGSQEGSGNESQEHIVGDPNANFKFGFDDEENAHAILKETEYSVQVENADTHPPTPHSGKAKSEARAV